MVATENKPGVQEESEAQAVKINKKEAEGTFWSVPLTYEIVGFPDIVVPHCDF